LARYHFGIFSFTGGGKSNLVSNIIRRIMYHTKTMKVVIFDISMEYPFLLQDVFSDKSISSKIITEVPIGDAEHFRKIIVTPRKFEQADVTPNLGSILTLGRVGHFAEGSEHPPTYEDILEEIKLLAVDDVKKAVNLNAINQIRLKVLQWIKDKHAERSQTVTQAFLEYLQTEAVSILDRFKVWKNSGLYAWASTRNELATLIHPEEKVKDDKSLGAEKIIELLEGDTRLLCLSIAEPNVVKQLAITLTSDMLRHRKREFQVEPQVLFVFDEAQEFIPAYEKARGIDSTCTQRIETLLRQGRKYGLGGCVATQRIAYLNTNALQQLHTYFVGPLPRPYDRSLVSSTFTIDQSILEKTLEFAPGQWLLSSYIATGMENVPIFITADNSEAELDRVIPTKR
jgi:DNA helicase HerA-like ATPase